MWTLFCTNTKTRVLPGIFLNRDRIDLSIDSFNFYLVGSAGLAGSGLLKFASCSASISSTIGQ